MVKLRLKRMGRTKRAFFRICAMDARNPRDGIAIEEIGYYDPIEPDDEKAVQIDTDRVQYWLQRGAQPNKTVHHLLRRHNLLSS